MTFFRFIPACAGNSRGRFRFGHRGGGSSPRVRGTRAEFVQAIVLLRFIPACAGNSRHRSTAWTAPPVHPRVCGELATQDVYCATFTGSSPRVRGTLGLTGAVQVAPTVHPRVCGELIFSTRFRAFLVGSSPRVRGTPYLHQPPEARLRFIPACAGNSQERHLDEPLAAVHPRVCGELTMRGTSAWCLLGSSPRVRGTHAMLSPSKANDRVHPRVCGELLRGFAMRRHARWFIPACAGNSRPRCGRWPPPAVHPRVCGELDRPAARRGAFRRFIPACAGNSACPSSSARTSPVHPRVCGELLQLQRMVQRQPGSSPRVRGTRNVRVAADEHLRFIPACAGNSNAAGGPAGVTAGSSPRVRGTLEVSGPPLARPRFIPACAGNSLVATPCGRARAVHPRVCGELLAARRRGARGRRFIPACAGNSRTAQDQARRAAVHPRVCGELVAANARIYSDLGSSPRVRGTPRRPRRGDPRRRFIPACAGNSSSETIRRITTPVHPRVCGELDAVADVAGEHVRFIPACAGNSRYARRGRPVSRRFIPACAGNSRTRPTASTLFPVHPRVCGELSGCSL